MSIDNLIIAVQEALACGDVDAALALLDAAPPDLAVEAYDRAQRDAYWTRKHVASMRAIARAGIRRLLALADADDRAAATSDAFAGRAKVLAYNLASFAWPGWDEPGVTLTADDVADGRDAARLNLRLAITLGRPDRTMADAHWLVGAHALAAGDLDAAAEAFAEARAFATAAGEPAKVAMLDGYAALVAALADPAATAMFDAAVVTLRAVADGSAYADQLSVAHAVFTRDRDAPAAITGAE